MKMWNIRVSTTFVMRNVAQFKGILFVILQKRRTYYICRVAKSELFLTSYVCYCSIKKIPWAWGATLSYRSATPRLHFRELQFWTEWLSATYLFFSEKLINFISEYFGWFREIGCEWALEIRLVPATLSEYKITLSNFWDKLYSVG